MISTQTMAIKAKGVVRLTRWKEFVPTTIPVTVVGAILAIQANRGASIDWRLIVVTLANCMVVAYAFMINDIEDAPDDAREAERASRNPVACGEVTPLEGWLASGGLAVIALALFALAGLWPFVFGCLTLALSHMYSWKPIRLKAYPVTDFVSHSLMLSGLLFLSGYFTYHDSPGSVWFVALSVTLISCYGQIYNQLRDFDMDKMAGLKNTAIMVGKRNAQFLMYSFIAVAATLLLYATVTAVFPIWIALFVAVVAPIVFYIIRSKTDARGTANIDVSGGVQWQFIILANAIVAAWLVATLLHIR
jgi:4-hydroxybenzoate polyprenyltransferase